MQPHNRVGIITVASLDDARSVADYIRQTSDLRPQIESYTEKPYGWTVYVQHNTMRQTIALHAAVLGMLAETGYFD